jgi:hypothetical protein
MRASGSAAWGRDPNDTTVAKGVVSDGDDRVRGKAVARRRRA